MAESHAEMLVREILSCPYGNAEDPACRRRLDQLLALAKQGEAYEEALAHARSLYRDGQQPLPGRLAAFKDWAQSGGPDGSEWIIVRREAAMLFASYFGHVPVESFAAAMTALEAAEKERDEWRSRDALMTSTWLQEHEFATDLGNNLADAEADRDRYATALERIEAWERPLPPRPFDDEARVIAREALNPGDSR